MNLILGGPIASFVTGSSLVSGLVPSDIDEVCLFNSKEDMDQFVSENRRSSPDLGSYPVRFVCARNGNKNFICTLDPEFFYRFKAFSGALSLLQEKDKAKRIELAKACLYWPDSEPGGSK